MDDKEFIKATNAYLAFVLLISTLLIGGRVILRSHNPGAVSHVLVDSTNLGKK
jgi:hypothetical protein